MKKKTPAFQKEEYQTPMFYEIGMIPEECCMSAIDPESGKPIDDINLGGDDDNWF